MLLGPHHAFLSWGCQVGLPSPVYEGLASCAHTEIQSLSSMGPQMSTWAFFQAAEPHTYPCGPLLLGVCSAFNSLCPLDSSPTSPTSCAHQHQDGISFFLTTHRHDWHSGREWDRDAHSPGTLQPQCPRRGFLPQCPSPALTVAM